MQLSLVVVFVLAAVAVANPVAGKRMSEVWTEEEEATHGVVRNSITSPVPSTYITSVPAAYSWGDVNGVSYLTKSLNQHLPQYCGSCWAHGALSALGDRIKIARNAQGVDINLAVQYILNCGNAGSCHGGSAAAVYQYIKGNPNGVPFDTCQPYMACSSESTEGICKKGDWSCTAMNTCRSCSTFPPEGKCVGVAKYPNATIAQYGDVSGEAAMMAEIFARGPIACGIDASQILDYTGGVTGGTCGGVDHIVSVVGWGVDNATNTKFWIVRNSWGEFYGEMGYLRVTKGNNDLCLESSCSWATPATWTERNFPCFEDASNCAPTTGRYVDPSERHPSV